MAEIARIISSENRGRVVTLVVNPTSGDNVTVEMFSPLGEDSLPMVGDYAHLSDTAGSGRLNSISYVDPLNERVAEAGEKRIYARAEDGTTVASVHLKRDGVIESKNGKSTVTQAPDGAVSLVNGAGSVLLLADGSINLNGVLISTDGAVTVPASLVLNGREIHNHDHPAGSPPGVTGANNP